MRILSRAICAAILLCLSAFSVAAQVPVSLAPSIRQQFFSASGVPLSGGFVAVYVAGTSVPAPIYLDSTGVAQNTNPAVLDSGGFISLWLPSTPVDIAVFNSSMTQQYKVLNVTALPAEVSSLTAGFFQSSSTNPALSGFLRLASPDQICWRNNGNSVDVCIEKSTADTLFYNGFQFAFLGSSQSWGGTQIFTTLEWTSGTAFVSTLANFNTAGRVYIFPDTNGTLCTDSATVPCALTSPDLTAPNINGIPVVSIPTDYDDFSQKSISTSGTVRTNTIPAGAVQNSATPGSIIEIETTFFIGAFTGSAPTYGLLINGQNIATIPVVAVGTADRYDVRCTVTLLASSAFAVCNETDNAPAVVNIEQTTLTTITGALSTLITESLSFPGTATAGFDFQHVRIRK